MRNAPNYAWHSRYCFPPHGRQAEGAARGRDSQGPSGPKPAGARAIVRAHAGPPCAKGRTRRPGRRSETSGRAPLKAEARLAGGFDAWHSRSRLPPVFAGRSDRRLAFPVPDPPRIAGRSDRRWALPPVRGVRLLPRGSPHRARFAATGTRCGGGSPHRGGVPRPRGSSPGRSSPPDTRCRLARCLLG